MALSQVIFFGGASIFGVKQNRVSGPTVRTRILRHRLPGVPGYRTFRLTGDSVDGRIWTCEGRIIEFGLNQVMQSVMNSQQFVDGKFYVFTTIGGLSFKNCELTDFRPVGNYQRIIVSNQQFYSVVVRGVIEQATP
jgi:hypothetical protein